MSRGLGYVYKRQGCCIKRGAAMSKFNINKLTPMLDKADAGLAKAGKAVV